VVGEAGDSGINSRSLIIGKHAENTVWAARTVWAVDARSFGIAWACMSVMEVKPRVR
jgi:hypothetical protein